MPVGWSQSRTRKYWDYRMTWNGPFKSEQRMEWQCFQTPQLCHSELGTGLRPCLNSPYRSGLGTGIRYESTMSLWTQGADKIRQCLRLPHGRQGVWLPMKKIHEDSILQALIGARRSKAPLDHVRPTLLQYLIVIQPMAPASYSTSSPLYKTRHT